MWDQFVRAWPIILAVANTALALSATVHIVLHKRDHRAAIGWTGLVWLTPLVGTVLYFILGINRIQRKALALELQEAWKHRSQSLPVAKDGGLQTEFAAQYPAFRGLARVGYQLTGRPLHAGNHVQPFRNGDEAFPVMLAAIDQADRSVSILSYIFDDDRVGRPFLDALKRAADRGVEVRVLIDGVGARYSRPNMVKRLRGVGLTAELFLPTRVPRLSKYANLRNHRKIMVIDGKIGFTGGTNLREQHCLALQPCDPAECMHFRIEGPVVEQIQEAFVIDWAFAANEKLEGDSWFPRIDPAGSVWARGIPDGPDEDFEKLSSVLQGALATATERVSIATPYFLPEASLIAALNGAALRGVDVCIYLPADTNIPVVNWAAATLYAPLLEKGCRILLSPIPFDHAKLMVVDRFWSLIGSSNWDPRSLRLNFEFNVECYSKSLADQLETLFEKKAEAATPVTIEMLNQRSLPVRLRDGLARLLIPYL